MNGDRAGALASLARASLLYGRSALAEHLADEAERWGRPNDFNTATAIMARTSLGQRSFRASIPKHWKQTLTALAIDAYVRACYGEALGYLAQIKGRSRNPVAADVFKSYLRMRSVSQAADINFGVLDYKSPDESTVTKNIGDYIQTLAVMRKLARYWDSAYWRSEGEDYDRIFAGLRSESAPCRLPQTGRNVLVLGVDRDCPAASLRRWDGGRVWTVVNGYCGLPPFRLGSVFEYPDQVEPIFISVHIPNIRLLTPQAKECLKQAEPVGCRDWSTVWMLLNQGIDAFFSGCVTQTFQPAEIHGKRTDKSLRLAVDAIGQPRHGWRVVVHEDPLIKRRSRRQNLETAKSVLEQYAAAEQIETSRLHCFLPARALGAPVTFNPRRASDARFDGLIDIDDDAFTEQSKWLDARLEAAIEHVLKFNDPVSFRNFWRELNRENVQEAKKRLQDGRALFTCNQARMPDISTRGKAEKSVHIALSFDRRLMRVAPVCMRSVTLTTDKPVVFHCLVRGLVPSDKDYLRSCSEGRVECYNMDYHLNDKGFALYSHTTVSTMDRLLLPDLIQGLNKIVYLDVDVIVQRDISMLIDVDVGATGIAACTDTVSESAYLFDCVERICRNVSADCARELRLRSARTMDLAGRTFNAGVLVMSLDSLRRHAFTQKLLAFVEKYKCDDQTAMNMFACGRYTELDATWNAMVHYRPTEENSAILHWAGSVKPWSHTACLFREKWWRIANELTK